MSHPFLSERRDDFYSQILRVSHVIKGWFSLSGVPQHVVRKGTLLTTFASVSRRSGCESCPFPDVSQTFPKRGARLGKASFPFKTNTDKSAEIVLLLYNVIQKTY